MKRKSKTKYIILTNQHLYLSDSLEAVNKKSGLSIDESEMKLIDGHFIAKLDETDIEFCLDKSRMSNIPWKNLIKKDNTLQYILYGVIALQVITLLKG